jgi:hypothetical protein
MYFLSQVHAMASEILCGRQLSLMTNRARKFALGPEFGPEEEENLFITHQS